MASSSEPDYVNVLVVVIGASMHHITDSKRVYPKKVHKLGASTHHSSQLIHIAYLPAYARSLQANFFLFVSSWYVDGFTTINY